MPKVAEVKRVEARKERVGRFYTLGNRALVAIDPGDVHVGYAWFESDKDGLPVCSYAMEVTPDECADRVARALAAGELAAVAVEKFTLYADKALEQTGSEMLTSELIGVIRYLIRVNNEGYRADPKNPWVPPSVGLWMEGAHIKKGIRAQLKARGIDRIGTVGSHSGDAEEHGWYHLLRKGSE